MTALPQHTPLDYWIYRSRAQVRARSPDSALIYLQSRARNEAWGLTGYLHREGDVFVQYVEGPTGPLNRLIRAIRADRRHDAIETLARGIVSARRFPTWDMAFTGSARHSYAETRRARGACGDISRASASDLLRFMQEAVASGAARTVRDSLPRRARA